MKTRILALHLMSVLGISIFWVSSACATTWYVRDGGGTPTQCTGTTNAVYSGSGSGQPCAFNHPNYAFGWDTDHNNPGAISSGDTVYIDGDSDIAPGTQAQYMIGYDATGGTTPSCSSSYPYDCTLYNIPAGISASQPTSIIGTGTHKPQLWGNQRVWQVLSANNNYITLQWLEVTDHQACAYVDPVNGCNYGGPYPYGAWAEDGIILGGTGLTLTDVYVHGVGRYGVNMPTSLGSFGNMTFTRLWVIGNGYGGFTTGESAAGTGTMTFNQPIIEWNGCAEAYPMTNTGIDNPANYSNCFGQASGGYGDGLAFGPDGNLNAGNWTLIGPGSISFNTQDGLDTLHGDGNGTINVDKMRFEGNAGQQVKANGDNFSLTNSIVIGDCGWWYKAAQSASGAMNLGDVCRANGDAILFNVTNGSTANIFNNTILSNGSIVAESTDGESTGCNSSTAINFKNNVVYGGYYWGDDTAFNGSGGNALTSYIYNDGSNGDGAGSCGTLTWNEDYNIVYNTKNNNQNCVGAHDKCGTNPGFASTIPMGTAGGAANTYYQGNVAESLVSLSSSSVAIATGVAGLTYWNTENDYHNVTRTSPPSMGGLEVNSCAANSYGCFSNSDCCGGSCSSFFCGAGGSTPQPVVSIVSLSSGSSFTTGTNVTVTATASESNGTITNISIYNGSTLLGSSNSSSYTYVMSNAAAGTYTLTAVATDANGVSTTSSPITLTAILASILPSLPVVTITSPTSGSSFTAGSNVTVTTTASESNGTISNISLYSGSGILLGSSSISPYNYVDSNMAAGTYTFYAVAKDVNGASTTSSPITITVTASPVPVVVLTSPVNGSTFTKGALITVTATASETNGSIASVSFYNGAAGLLSTVTAPPYTYSWNNGVLTSYTVTAVATDANGVSTTSSPATITLAAAAPSSSPVIALTSPASGSSFTVGSSITMTAAASETNGTITQVQFYNGTTFLGAATSNPFSVTWSNVAAGSYSLSAIATDANGVSVTSSPITVTVAPVLPSLPVVTLTSPVNGSTFTKGALITVTATASETNGSIASVSFYNGAAGLLSTVTAPPYTYSWNNGVLTSYTVTAVATDANGVSTTSSPATITLAAAAPSSSPVIALTSPASGSSFTAGSSITMTAAASETNGTITQVQFYNGTTLLGTGPASGGTGSPYAYTWTNVPAGSYILTAIATDANGVSTTSSVVTTTVTAPAPVVVPTITTPVVTITGPANNSTLTAGSNMTITASATETNGTIATVFFYNGTTLLGSSSTSPYSYTVTNISAGTYVLTVMATDQGDNTVTSTAVAVTVSALPPVSLPSNNTSLKGHNHHHF